MSSSPSQSYAVVGEIWSAFEGTLQVQAKRLVEDIAKFQNVDPKVLWAKIRPQIKVGILDVELDDELPTTCSHASASCDGGAIKTRCRAPCLLGFDACPRHVNTPKQTTPSNTYPMVDRILDYQGHTYYVDSHKVARDRNGRPRGVVEDNVLYLFEVSTQSGSKS